tara:strand:- start:105 stop:395 length:291 start_codon:yes stop_codon:yes gene_type:complete
MYNLMSCGGFGNEVMGGCSMAWVGFAMLFFVVVFSRKWLGEEVTGMNYDALFGFIGAYLPYIILISIFGEAKWALLGGIIGSLAGGLGLGSLRGGY